MNLGRKQTAARPRYSLVLKLIFFSRLHHGHYLGPPPASPAAAAEAPTAARAPPEPCISSLSALRRFKRRGSGERWADAAVLFGSATAKAEERAAPPPLSPRRAPLWPALGEVEGEGEGDGEGVGGGGGGGGGAGDKGCEGLGAAEVGAGGTTAAGEAPPVSSPAASEAAGPLVEVKPVGAKGMGLFAAR